MLWEMSLSLLHYVVDSDESRKELKAPPSLRALWVAENCICASRNHIYITPDVIKGPPGYRRGGCHRHYGGVWRPLPDQCIAPGQVCTHLPLMCGLFNFKVNQRHQIACRWRLHMSSQRDVLHLYELSKSLQVRF